MAASKFHIYGYGRAAENYVGTDNLLNVILIEKLPLQHGELSEDTEDIETSGVDADGVAYSASCSVSNTIECKWLPTNTNRVNAPNIRRGEPVLVYRWADSLEHLYWVSLDTELLALRRSETATYLFSANDDLDVPNDPSNSIVLNVSGVNGVIELTTPETKRFPIGLTFQINLNELTLNYVDTVGNSLTIDSSDKQFNYTNSDNSSIDVSEMVITFTCDDAINLLADNSVNLKTKNLNIEANTVSIRANTITSTGEWSHDGKFKTKDLDVINDAKIDKKLTATNIKSPNPVDAPR